MATNHATRKSLIYLRNILKAWESKHHLVAGAPKITFKYFWSIAEGEEPEEISREEFLSLSPDEQHGGHPKTGIYTVKGYKQIDGEEVPHEPMDASGWFDSPADSGGGGGDSERSATNALHHLTAKILESSTTALARKDGEVARAEKRARDAADREEQLINSLAEARAQLADMRIEVMSANQALDEMAQKYESLEVQIEQEREDNEARKSSLVAVVSTIFDRGVQQIFGQPGVAATNEAIREATDHVLERIVSTYPNETLRLVRLGMFEWEEIAVLFYMFYGDIFPEDLSGPPPEGWEPDGGWVPLSAVDDSEEDEESDEEEEDDAEVIETEGEDVETAEDGRH